MKKYFILSLVVVVAFSVIGCSDDGKNPLKEDRLPATEDDLDTNGDSLSLPLTIADSPERLAGTKWQLVDVSVSKEYEKLETVNFLEAKIFFEFQDKNKLIVTGKTDELFIGELYIFEHFREGEHFYEYGAGSEACPTCSQMPAGLDIDYPEFGSRNGRYQCVVDLDNRTMKIGGEKVVGGTVHDNGLVTGGKYYRWEKTFMLLSN